MLIPLICDCSHAMRVEYALAGKKIRCPACNTILLVPKPEMPQNLADEGFYLLEEANEPSPFNNRASTQDLPATDALTPTRAGPRSQASPELPTPEWKKKTPNLIRKPRRERRGGLFSSVHFHPLVGSGLLMMFGAVVWLVVGLMFGWFYYGPPVLFVLGIVAIFKGLTGHDDV